MLSTDAGQGCGRSRSSSEVSAGRGGGGAKGSGGAFLSDRSTEREESDGQATVGAVEAVRGLEDGSVGGVAGNRGAASVDGVEIDEFEEGVQNNLYKVGNRMASGSYFPVPARVVDIPKPRGAGVRMLGVPTVADRVAQRVAARRIEAVVEPRFHPDSYGFRPGWSAHDVVEQCRRVRASS